MQYKLSTDDEIITDLGERVEYLRRLKGLQSKELCDKGGVGYTAYRKLVNGKGSVSLKTMIGILRGLDELDKLEQMFTIHNEYSPTMKSSTPPKRIFKKHKTKHVVWGDEK